MSSISEDGYIQNYTTWFFSKLKKWYTYFREWDVLMAKITPCMENKKSCIVDKTIHWFWFWSTEFHSFRTSPLVLNKYLFYFLRWNLFLKDCELNFNWAAWHKRVPAEFISNYELPLPDIQTQKQIVQKIETQFAQIDTIRREVLKQQGNLKELRKAILFGVFGGFED
jgi:type I restriction enzyme S subunit